MRIQKNIIQIILIKRTKYLFIIENTNKLRLPQKTREIWLLFLEVVYVIAKMFCVTFFKSFKRSEDLA